MNPPDEFSHRLTEADSIGFEPDGTPVPVTWPAANCPAGNLLDDLVENAGAIFPDRITALHLVREFADSQREGLTGFAKALDALLTGAKDAQTAGRRLLIVGYLFERPAAAQTQAELAVLLGVSKPRVEQLVKDFKLWVESSGISNKESQKAA